MASIKEIALKTGYSTSSVSVVLSGKGDSRHISAKTQGEIINAARDMGYTPNVSARRLRSNHGKKMIVVYWASDYRAALVFRFLQGMYQFMSRKKALYEIIIHPFRPGMLTDIASPAEINAYSACIVCTATEKDIAFLEKLTVITPIVLYNRYSEKFSSVMMDNGEIGAFAARVLREKGAKNAYAVSAEKNLIFIKERLEAFVSAFEKLGGRVRMIDVGDNSISSAYNSVSGPDFAQKSPFGIFCTTDILLMGIIKKMNELKISEKKVKMVCISMLDKEISSFILPHSSIIEIPIERMGYKCLELVEKIIRGDISKARTIKISL